MLKLMRALITRARALSGHLRVPGDKSISHRAVLFGALAKGTTRVTGLAPGGDVRSSMACARHLGVDVTATGEGSFELRSPGRSDWLREALRLDAGNSGTTARLLLGMLTPVTGLTAHIEGDPSLSGRPMKRIAGPLGEMGAEIALTSAGTLPAAVQGRTMQGRRHQLKVSSAQVKTALLLAGLAAEGETWVHEPETSRDHTERLLPAFGVNLLRGEAGIGVRAQSLVATTLTVPGDPSSAAFFAVAAAIVPGSRLTLAGVGTNPTRTGVVEVLRGMGARIHIDETVAPEPYGVWTCETGTLRGTTISGAIIPRLIDEIPVLAIAAALSPGTTTIRDASELRVKESDRLKLVAAGLIAMGADVEELPDGLIIRGGRPLRGARIDSGMDHRIAMSFAVAGLVADGETVIEGAEWADISFPGFFRLLSEVSGGAVRTA
jgi:3-phosphoshikimate 1-carboxyvinyltransferase